MRRAVGLAVAASLLAAGCTARPTVDAASVSTPITSSSTSSRAPAPPATLPDPSGTPITAELVRKNYDRLCAQIRVDPTYAGMALHGRGLQVWAVGSGSAQLRAAVAAVHQVRVQIITARHSAREMSAVIRQLSHDRPALKSRGIELSSWGPDLYANIVVVGLRHYSPARAAYLVHRYGADLLTVTPRSEVIVPL
jgi:hypothetical protein